MIQAKTNTNGVAFNVTLFDWFLISTPETRIPNQEKIEHVFPAAGHLATRMEC